MLFFLGNKAFVIDFLETGQFCCVYWYDRLGNKSLGKYISPTRISTGLHSNLSGVLLLSVNNILFSLNTVKLDFDSFALIFNCIIQTCFCSADFSANARYSSIGH